MKKCNMLRSNIKSAHESRDSHNSLMATAVGYDIVTGHGLKGNAAYFLKTIILWMKTIHYPNTLRSHLVTIVPIALFTPKSTSKLRSALHFRYSIVIRRFIPALILRNPNNQYNHGFPNTFN